VNEPGSHSVTSTISDPEGSDRHLNQVVEDVAAMAMVGCCKCVLGTRGDHRSYITELAHNDSSGQPQNTPQRQSSTACAVPARHPHHAEEQLDWLPTLRSAGRTPSATTVFSFQIS
jgi:hypothetical protein